MMRLLALAVLLLAACELAAPYDRSNPFDPGSPYPMQLVGVPDTVSYVGQRFQVDIQRTPPIDIKTLSIAWQSYILDANQTPAPQVKHLAQGDFLSNNAMTARMVSLTIGAKFNDDVVVGRTFVAGQLVQTLNLNCSAPCASLPLSVGNTLQVFSDARDAGGYPVQAENFAMQRALVTIRTPGVLASMVTANPAGTYAFSAVGAGSTWIVIRSDHAIDSVQVTVTP